MNEITTQDLVNAWVDVVIDEIKDFERMHDMYVMIVTGKQH